MCIYHLLFIHSSADRHLGCFPILVTVKIASVSEEYKNLFKILTLSPLKKCPEVELLDQIVRSI